MQKEKRKAHPLIEKCPHCDHGWGLYSLKERRWRCRDCTLTWKDKSSEATEHKETVRTRS